jgi:hypothetical protein
LALLNSMVAYTEKISLYTKVLTDLALCNGEVKALRYKPEGRGFKTNEMNEFI